MKCFENHFKEIKDFRYDVFGLSSWSAMRKIVADKSMPAKPFDNWKQD
jgi:hypothetical protein